MAVEDVGDRTVLESAGACQAECVVHEMAESLTLNTEVDLSNAGQNIGSSQDQAVPDRYAFSVGFKEHQAALAPGARLSLLL
jgi:hypothetical protein